MNLLLIDSDGTGLDMAYRAAEAGHAVRLWQPKENGKASRDGEGFPGITKVNGWKESMTWAKAGLIVNLFNGPLTVELDRFRGFGFPVFGPSTKSASLEINRASGMKALEKNGVRVPPYQTFGTLKDAQHYAAKTDRRLVFKTLGDEEDKSLSYVASDPDDMVWRIESWIKGKLVVKGDVMLQDFVDGIEVGVSGWMGKDGFLPGKWNVNFEFKKLMPGDYGPNTGEMGTVCQYAESSKLAAAVLEPMEATLREAEHIGDVDLNAIIDDKGEAWALEFTSRFGWPSTQILMHCHKGDPIKWMKEALNGKDTLEVDTRTAIGVLMAAPPFPYPDEDQEAADLLVSGIESEWKNIAPWQIRLEGKHYFSTGPYVCLAMACASDVESAMKKVYKTCEEIKFANRMVRTDIGARLEKQLPILHKMGYEEMPQWQRAS